jgi:hypothetical protein
MRRVTRQSSKHVIQPLCHLWYAYNDFLARIPLGSELFCTNAMFMLESKQNRRSHVTIAQDNWLSHQALGALLQEGRAARNDIAWLEHMLNSTLGLLLDQTSMRS